MKNYIFIILTASLLLSGCSSKNKKPKEKSLDFKQINESLLNEIAKENNPYDVIEDIPYSESIDNKNFKICNNYVFQYYNNSIGLLYEEEKPALNKLYFDKYNSDIVKKESGLIRIRFIVNCKGETGRYRTLAMDKDYKEKIFDYKITNQLLKITKELNGWGIQTYEGRNIDYYQYLIFVIKEGKLIKILP